MLGIITKPCFMIDSLQIIAKICEYVANFDSILLFKKSSLTFPSYFPLNQDGRPSHLGMETLEWEYHSG